MTDDAADDRSGPDAYAYKPYSGLAIAAMVCGICGMWTVGISSLVGLVLGYRARRQIKQGHRRGDGMAITGIVLGWLVVAGAAGVLGCTVLLTAASGVVAGGG